MRVSPFCLGLTKDSKKRDRCELTYRQPLELVFRSPDWRKQNGFVLFYELTFEKCADKSGKCEQNSEQKFVVVSERAVKNQFKDLQLNRTDTYKTLCDHFEKNRKSAIIKGLLLKYDSIPSN